MKARFILICILTCAIGVISCSKEADTPTVSQSINPGTPSNIQVPDSAGPPPGFNLAVGQGGEHHSEQIVFSGTGFSNELGPFGFWIWSQDEDANSPVYAGEAAGAMYLYALPLTVGVEGDVEETAEGIYEITVDSRKPGLLSAILENADEPVHGPHNTVDVTFTNTPGGAGTGTSTNAVVVVTGPEE